MTNVRAENVKLSSSLSSVVNSDVSHQAALQSDITERELELAWLRRELSRVPAERDEVRRRTSDDDAAAAVSVSAIPSLQTANEQVTDDVRRLKDELAMKSELVENMRSERYHSV